MLVFSRGSTQAASFPSNRTSSFFGNSLLMSCTGGPSLTELPQSHLLTRLLTASKQQQTAQACTSTLTAQFLVWIESLHTHLAAFACVTEPKPSETSGAVVVNGQDLFTIPGLLMNSPATAPAYQGDSVPSPGSSAAVDIQVAVTDLPGVIAGLASLNTKGPPSGRKMI